MKKSDCKKIDSFELWCLRRILRISWMEHRTNASVLQQVNIDGSDRLLSKIKCAQLKFFGHVTRADGLERKIVDGMVFGKRAPGRPKTKWTDNIKEGAGMSIIDAGRAACDRRRWRSICHLGHGRSES